MVGSRRKGNGRRCLCVQLFLKKNKKNRPSRTQLLGSVSLGPTWFKFNAASNRPGSTGYLPTDRRVPSLASVVILPCYAARHVVTFVYFLLVTELKMGWVSNLSASGTRLGLTWVACLRGETVLHKSTRAKFELSARHNIDEPRLDS